MEVRPLGRCGLKVTPLCLGAMTFGQSHGFMKGVTSDDDEARRVLDRALDAGVNLVDTANVYSEGRSEELLGRWLEGRRARLLLATKCRFPTSPGNQDPHEQGLSRRNILRACEESLRRLRTDWIDLWQVHMQDTSVPVEETLSALDTLVRDGKVRYVGCSNYTGYRLVESLWSADRRGTVRYESVQLQYSLAVRDAEREVLPACRAFGLGTLVWSPLGRGFLSGKYKRDQPPPAGTRLQAWHESWHALATERNWDVVEALRETAQAHSTSIAAVALAWLLQRPGVTSLVIGARTVAQLDDNLRALDVRLSAAEVAALEELSRPAWGYPCDFIGYRQEW